MTRRAPPPDRIQSAFQIFRDPSLRSAVAAAGSRDRRRRADEPQARGEYPNIRPKAGLDVQTQPDFAKSMTSLMKRTNKLGPIDAVG